MCACVFFTACGQSGLGDPEQPGGDQSDGASGDTDGSTELVTPEDADILALSYDRLQNADLQFDFSIELGNKTVKSVENGGTALSAAQNVVLSDTVAEEVFETGFDDEKWVQVEEFNYFESNQEHLDIMSEEARDLADYCIDNITVTNKAVEQGMYTYLLSYDAATDTVTAQCKTVYLEGDFENTRVSIYYDEDGDETVDMVRLINNSNSEQTEHIVYTKNKYYLIETYYVEEGWEGGMYNIQVAYKDKETGLWRGVSTAFNSQNPYLTGEGVYDYGNGMLNLQFIFETENALFEFNDRVIAMRFDGENWYETGSSVEADPDDKMELEQYSLYATDGVSCEQDWRLISTQIAALTGWKTLHIVLDTESEINSPYSEQYFRDEKDYLELDDGTRLIYGSVWTRDLGWLTPTDSSRYDAPYVAADGTTVDAADLGDEYVNFGNGIIQIYGEPKEIGGGVFNFGVSVDGSDAASELLYDCFVDSGLGFRNTSAILFKDMSDLQQNRTVYADQVFEYLFGCAYTADDFMSQCGVIIDNFADMKSSVGNSMEGLEKVQFKDLPDIVDVELVTLADKIEGTAQIDSNGVDFSGMTVNVPKSVIFREDSTYCVYVGWGSAKGSVSVSAFDDEVFEGKAMTFAGKSGLALPETTTEGEYTLVAFFGKRTDDGVIRLSETVPVAVEGDGASYQVSAGGGYLEHTIAMTNGVATLTVAFVDTQAPSVAIEGEADGNLTLGGPVTVGEFKQLVSVVDNYSSVSVSVEKDGAVLADDGLMSADEYTVVAVDEDGNRTEIVVVVAFETTM